jgi:Sulfotransferase domain
VRPAVCEASPDYLYHRDVPARLAALMPEARLVALLRDPVDRAYSHYQHERDLGTETLTFEEALDAEGDRLAAGSTYDWFMHQHYSYCARGRYLEQLERWLVVFERGQLLVVRSEDLFADPEGVVNRILRHAGLPGGFRGTFPRQNSLTYAGLDPDTRARLAAYFRPYNDQLARAFGPEFGWA